MVPVVVCFGTTSVSGDSFAPIVGSILKNQKNVDCFVYGDIDSPIDAKHAKEAIEHIEQVHKDSLIIAVDACVGRQDAVGKIRVKPGGVRPAEAIKSPSQSFGDIGILAVVAKISSDALSELMMTSQIFVNDLAKKTAVLIANFVKMCQVCEINITHQ